MEVCCFVEKYILPTMARSDVENSILIVYPVLWILKDNGCSIDAKQMFHSYVVNNLGEYGSQCSGSFQPIVEPVRMLLDLLVGSVSEEDLGKMMEWALNEENLRFDFSLNCTMGHMGRCPDSVSAEICLLLARIHPDPHEVSMLIQTGLTLSMEVLNLTDERRMRIAYHQVLPIYQFLQAMDTTKIIDSAEESRFGTRFSI